MHVDLLLTLPPAAARFAATPTDGRPLRRRLAFPGIRRTWLGSDPAGRRLGSGGGTVQALHAAWASQGGDRGLAFASWLGSSAKLVLHAGGESRRLPAYAPLGKALLPLPAAPRLGPLAHDQVLADFQVPPYAEALREAGPHARVLVASGDVWLGFEPADLGTCTADIVGVGMRVEPEVASDFGVFFVAPEHGARGGAACPVSCFLQKPSAAVVRARARTESFFVDTGLWFLSARAIDVLRRACGWNEEQARFTTSDGAPATLDLYGEVGIALGRPDQASDRLRRAGFGDLTSAVVPLPSARFLHLGSSRQLLETMGSLAADDLARNPVRIVASPPNHFAATGRQPAWVDASLPAGRLSLGGENILTGLPPGARLQRLSTAECVAIWPVGRREHVVLPYHLDDRFRGPPEQATICGQPARTWLQRREAPGDGDVFDLPLYPVLAANAITQELLDGFFAAEPPASWSGAWRGAQRLSAREIPGAIDYRRLGRHREQAHVAATRAAFLDLLETGNPAVLRQDADALAHLVRRHPTLHRWIERQAGALQEATRDPVPAARLQAFLGRIARTPARAARRSAAAFRLLRESVLERTQVAPAAPRCALKEDQIVWARSPVRLDLAGGWTDTPPFCFEAGGTVLNAAVVLNGQPPIQVFARRLDRPVLRFRSIDLGTAETVASLGALRAYRDPGSSFALAKAAAAVAGFDPRYFAGPGGSTLPRHLRLCGGGLELSLLCAVPKGSGLGTSSILAATLLGALNRALALGWDATAIYQRVLAVEQLMTTGGGWQDQAGGLLPGLKLIETQPGLDQLPTVRHLPGRLFDDGRFLLYYTGITRLAAGILRQIVRDMFLGRAATRRTLEAIRTNARRMHHAVQTDDRAEVARGLARSWRLNRELDPGTSTPAIDRLLASCGADLAAAKLLGAGGGGYLLLCARDAAAAGRIRERLERRPPNPRARFVDFALSPAGLEVTVS